MKQIYLFPGLMAYSEQPAQITTILGSCVGVALYDPQLKSGGLNHYLLASHPKDEKPTTRYGSCAIPELIHAMERCGARRELLKAKVYGGANVLSAVYFGNAIGQSNVEMALRILEEYSIPVIEQNVGGKRGRKIMLTTDSFDVVHQFQGQGAESDESVDTTGYRTLKTAKDIRVLIVDDSASVRHLFQKIFEKHGLNVVGTAANAFEARELIVQKSPSVITLDLEMPQMNGIAFLEKLMKHMPTPVVVVSSLGAQGEAAYRALELGAVEFVHKTSQYDPNVLRELGEMLVEKVKAAASVNVLHPPQERTQKRTVEIIPSASLRLESPAELRLIVVGGNTGSQKSLESFLTVLPSDTPPVLVANSSVTAFLEQYLAKLTPNAHVQFVVAKTGDIPRVGYVYFAPANHHLRVKKNLAGLVLQVEQGKPYCNQIPSASLLFDSATKAVSGGVIGILTSGFGQDGVDGLQKIQSHGGTTVVEKPDEAVFPYVPQNAIAMGVVNHVCSASEMASLIMTSRNRRAA